MHFIANILSTQSFDGASLDDITSRRDVFRSPNDLTSTSLDHHLTNNDLTNNSFSSSSSSSLSNSFPANNIYTTGPTSSDILNSSSSNLATSSNGQQTDPLDLQAFESYYHGRSLNNDQIFLVIYIIDTFRYELMGTANSDNDDINIDESIDIYVKKSIFRIYMDLIKDLPEKTSFRIHIQVNENFF